MRKECVFPDGECYSEQRDGGIYLCHPGSGRSASRPVGVFTFTYFRPDGSVCMKTTPEGYYDSSGHLVYRSPLATAVSRK
jgi:hypothetical protein